ncbi:MAG: hypothetical protein ABI794_02075, partial [Betaproteobacteria bacterium]
MHCSRLLVQTGLAAVLVTTSLVVARAQAPFIDPYLYVPMPYAPALAVPCYPYCGLVTRNRIQERRRERANALRADDPPRGAPDGSLKRDVRLRPAEIAPESELQPAYHGSGSVLPQYDQSGKVLPAYAQAVPSNAVAPPAGDQAPGPKR